ncbi:RHTO0S03e08790g1_1 [Rhodotorula toruloides]|uniref:RHTO0S03e08790g1_1 n=2 Tax=Rhodotorula toruloides TaxID=5286 RepID=A0A061AUH4_RHOTO|nr:uncharacterized protein RHTO_00422 [Rhodotorula toruloides NP11]EMS25994.1 hypothetical protein RHTO_00422 [Rhodotorula toruloides NP11]CDR38373.1 RHTO0S03e08790g1_1 [Rhodotorula toruloides]
MPSPPHNRRGSGGRGSSPLEEGNAHRSPAVLRSQQREVPRDEIDDAIDGAWDDQEEEERRREERERQREKEREERRAREWQQLLQVARLSRTVVEGFDRRSCPGSARTCFDKRSSDEHVGFHTDSEGGEQAGWNPEWDDAIDGGWSDEDATNARAEEAPPHQSRRSSRGARR